MRNSIPTTRWFWDGMAMALLTGVLGWLSLAFTRGPGELAAVWFSSGVLAGWLLAGAARGCRQLAVRLAEPVVSDRRRA